MENKIIALFIIAGLLLGIPIGYIIGYSAGLGWSFDKAIWLLDHQGIKIEFNEEMIKTGFTQYRDRVGGCMFTENLTNASIHNNKRD